MVRMRLLRVLVLLGLPTLILVFVMGCEAPYSNPAKEFQESDLAGTWLARYGGGGQDTLIIKADGTFRQVYGDRYVDGYTYETPWYPWWVERFPDGRIRLYLQGARYYMAGIEVAERNGMSFVPDRHPWLFWDPIARDEVQMVDRLVLNAQMTSSGELVLLHMLRGADRGFISLEGGGAAVGFHRVKGPAGN